MASLADDEQPRAQPLAHERERLRRHIVEINIVIAVEVVRPGLDRDRQRLMIAQTLDEHRRSVAQLLLDAGAALEANPQPRITDTGQRLLVHEARGRFGRTSAASRSLPLADDQRTASRSRSSVFAV